jgi:hypothetical protein
MRIFIIIILLFFFSCAIKPTNTIKCKGFKLEYINNDTLRFKTDLKYYNSIGDTTKYKFNLFKLDDDYECTNSFINHCYCDSKLEIVYTNEQSGFALIYTFYYSGNSNKVNSAIYKINGAMYFFDKEYNGIDYDSIIQVIDSTITEKKIKKIYIREGHIDRYIDENNIDWRKFK